MSRILLLSTSIENETRVADKKDEPGSHYPLGLAYLHSFLESKGHTVNTGFLNNIPQDLCLSVVEKFVDKHQPDFVGFNIITNNRVSTYRAIELIHAKYPRIKQIIGGIHTTVMWEQLVNRYPWVVAVIGEGETTAAELLENWDDLSCIRGIAYHDGQKAIKTEERELIADLDILPFPKHELFVYDRRVCACVLTSRGCPRNCSFCVLDSISRRKVRYRSVKNVVDELEYIQKKFPHITSVWFHDDSFLLDNKRAIAICDEIQRRKLTLKYVCSACFKPLSRELVLKLEETGFINILFGLESGSPPVMKAMRKGITQEDARNAFKLFEDKPLVPVTAFLIVGLPGETWKTLEETARFVQSLQMTKYSYYSDVGVATIYPGTHVYELAKEKGIIGDEYWLTDGKTPFYTAEHSEQELREMAEFLKDHIAMGRIASVNGYERQKKMIPYIIDYVMNVGDTENMDRVIAKAAVELGIKLEGFADRWHAGKIDKKRVCKKIDEMIQSYLLADFGRPITDC